MRYRIGFCPRPNRRLTDRPTYLSLIWAGPTSELEVFPVSRVGLILAARGVCGRVTRMPLVYLVNFEDLPVNNSKRETCARRSAFLNSPHSASGIVRLRTGHARSVKLRELQQDCWFRDKAEFIVGMRAGRLHWQLPNFPDSVAKRPLCPAIRAQGRRGCESRAALAWLPIFG